MLDLGEETTIYCQLEHAVGWARGLGRGERHIPQSENVYTVNVATLREQRLRRQGDIEAWHGSNSRTAGAG